MAPLIAVIGPDGSGKSTVCAELVAWVERYGPAQRVHLGKQAGNIGRALARWPLIGPLMGRRIDKAVDGANERMRADKPLGLLPALVITGFLLRRRRRFARMLALRERGIIVVADRFPQTSIRGAYDGPIFPDPPRGSALVMRLGRLEHETFEAMTRCEPDLVLRLNVDIETAVARKPDHRRAALERKISVTPHLTYRGAPIVDIDAAQPLADVMRDAETAVARMMAEKSYPDRTTREGQR
jgi:thymidylate kinase